MHTKGIWTASQQFAGHGASWIEDSDGCEIAQIVGESMGDPECKANLSLLALAPTAPHDCEDKTCPGAVNKRRLEAFDGLLDALKELALTPDNKRPSYVWNQVKTAIAKAERRDGK